MFFFFSKVFYFLIQPINWLIALLFYAIFTKSQRHRKTAIISAAIGVLFLTNPFIFNRLISKWEVRTDSPSVVFNQYDVGIILGSNQPPNVQIQEDTDDASQQASRVFGGLELYRKGRVKKLMLLNAPLHLGEDMSKAVLETKDFLLRVGVPESDLIVLTNSKNTHEHAVEVARYLKENMPGAKCLLLTSAWHTRRARGCFNKENIDIMPISIEYFSQTGKNGLRDILLPDSLGFYKWEFFLKEVIGYIVYWGQGYL